MRMRFQTGLQTLHNFLAHRNLVLQRQLFNIFFLKQLALENQISMSQEIVQRLQASLETHPHPAIDNSSCPASSAAGESVSLPHWSARRVTLRSDPDYQSPLKENIKQLALENQISMSQEIVQRLQASLETHPHTSSSCPASSAAGESVSLPHWSARRVTLRSDPD
jgi:CII-binding regulator of phage lambda lysogenization HflD